MRIDGGARLGSGRLTVRGGGMVLYPRFSFRAVSRICPRPTQVWCSRTSCAPREHWLHEELESDDDELESDDDDASPMQRKARKASRFARSNPDFRVVARR